jgi:hypothetical protein
MCNRVAGELVTTVCKGAQFIPGDVLAVLRGVVMSHGGWKGAFAHFLIAFVQHTIGLFCILALVVQFSSTGMVLNGSLVTQKTDRRRAFEKVVLICRDVRCLVIWPFLQSNRTESDAGKLDSRSREAGHIT